MKNLDTIAIQGGYSPKNGEARTLPIYQSTTFVYDKAEDMADLFDAKATGFFYSRIGNPTCDALEKKMAALDGGTGALATASGQSATLVTILNVCKAGDHIISSSTIYGGTYNLFAVTFKRMGIDCTFISPNASLEDIEKEIRPNTKIIFGETCSNPSLDVLDFDTIHKACEKHNILFVVDNTLATSVITRPIEFGANIVIYSTTKYTEGHASTIGGMIVDLGNFEFSKERYPEFHEPDESYHGLVYATLGGQAFILKARLQMMRDLGCYMSPSTAHLTNLGLETLEMRMEKHSKNAQEVANALRSHKKVSWVKYPFLEGDKNYDKAKKYMKMGSGIVVFGVKGTRKNAEQFINSLSMIKNVTHIADIRSCVLHPASTTHRQLSEKALKDCGIDQTMIRFSVGCENIEDILSDCFNALDKA